MKIGFAVAACVIATCGGAPAQAADDTLVGMWGYRSEFPVGPSGTLSVRRDGKRWHAAIAGQTAEATSSAGELRFAFPGGDGFRATLHGRTLDGYWIRRAVTGDPRYPQGATQAYAMPVALVRTGPAAWQGTVAPLGDPFTLYLKISRNGDGALVAAFRNPDMNSHGPAMQLDVAREGNAIRFAAKPDPDKSAVTLDATLASDRIAMVWPDLKRSIDLKRLSPGETAAFFPRPPGSPPYTYRMPEAAGDGWKTAQAGALGLDEAALAAAVQKIADIDPAARRRAYLVHSMAVAYRGKLVLDEYFYGMDRDTPHDMRSASKTFASVMLGAAALSGIRIAPETKAYTLLAPLGPFDHPDPLKREITLGDLMTHTSGLACDDNDESSPGNEDTMQSQRGQPRWWKYTLDLPMAYPPGTHYAYCSASINLTGAAVTVATGTWLPAWFEKSVARPLQFGRYYWNLMPDGEGYAGGGAFVRPRDFLKLGQVFLDGGVWNGRRIVSRAWAKLSTAPQRRISPETTGRRGDAFAEVYLDGYDGYAWHLLDVKSGGHVFHAYFANGNGGQCLLAVPELDLAIMFTAGNYQQGIGFYLLSIVADGVIPAVRR